MDGLWSSPDLPALLQARGAQPRRAGALRRLVADSGSWPIPRTLAHRARRNTRRPEPPQHRRALRPRQRPLPAVPRRDADLLECRLRHARPVPGRCAAQQVPAASPRGRADAPGMHVLEIGSGWGGFAMYAAGELGCRVTTVTISPEQHELATRARSRRPGLTTGSTSSCATTARSQGTYDAIVSIEMLEAVGAEYFGDVLRGLRPRRSSRAAG